MKKNARSWPTTITAGIISILSIVFSAYVYIPRFPEALFFCMILLFAVVSAVVAIGGRKGSLKELLHAISFMS